MIEIQNFFYKNVTNATWLILENNILLLHYFLLYLLLMLKLFNCVFF